jgi:hypothetical protein
MDRNKTRGPRPDASKLLIGLLIAFTLTTAGFGLYTYYYQYTEANTPGTVTLPR